MKSILFFVSFRLIHVVCFNSYFYFILFPVIIIFVVVTCYNTKVKKQQKIIVKIKKEKRTLQDDIFSKTEIAEALKSFNLTNPKPCKLFQSVRVHMNDAKWDELFSKVNEIYDGFIDRLQEKYANLSKEDLKLCCLLKLKVKVWNIALLLNIDKKSVNKHKTRLKLDKMKFRNSIDFDEFIVNF